MENEQIHKNAPASKAAGQEEAQAGTALSGVRSLAPPPLSWNRQPVQRTKSPAPATVIQRWRAPSEHTQAVSIEIPEVRPVMEIEDPVERNNAINQSYHEFDGAMSEYLGVPLIANWCTFGQHASREAGAQIRNISEGLNILRQDLPAMISPVAFLETFRRDTTNIPSIRALRRIKGLLEQPGMGSQAINLAFQQAGVSTGQISTIVEEADELADLDLWDPLEAIQINPRIALLAGRVSIILGQLAIATPQIIRVLGRILENMENGNHGIYRNIAPAFARFLHAANDHPQGMPQSISFDGDENEFLLAAFELYAEGKYLADEYGATGDRALLSERQEKIHRANLLIGFQEQLVILQPIFNTMMEELQAMSGTMILRDPSGTTSLIDNWGDFYTRMGIDPEQAPADPSDVTPDNLPGMHAAGDPMRSGTINEYFEDNLNNPRTHEAPPEVSRF